MLTANSWCFFTILAFGWFQMRSSSPVCFGSRDDTPGVFTIPFTGDVITFKLVHLFGYVNCGSTEATRSFWGCTHPNVPASHQMGTYITDPQKNRLLPKQEYVHEGWYCGQYWLPGQKPNSSELLFDNFTNPLPVSAEQQFMVWFNEALYDCGDSDNTFEKACTDVYALYV